MVGGQTGSALFLCHSKQVRHLHLPEASSQRTKSMTNIRLALLATVLVTLSGDMPVWSRIRPSPLLAQSGPVGDDYPRTPDGLVFTLNGSGVTTTLDPETSGR